MLKFSVSPQKTIHLKPSNSPIYQQINANFSNSLGLGLLSLDQVDHDLYDDESLIYLRKFTHLYLATFTSIPSLEKHDFKLGAIAVEFPRENLAELLLSVPPIQGAEYIDEECLLSWWMEITFALPQAVSKFDYDIHAFFTANHPHWNLLGRVCFNLAENKNSTEEPFAFLATYVHKISADGRSKHLPLSIALEEYADAKSKDLLLRLLEPIYKASKESAFLSDYLNSGDLYHPLAWNQNEAYQFLKDVPIFERSGIAVKTPNWWQSKQIISPKIKVKIGEKDSGILGINNLLSFDAKLTIGDEEISEEELRKLLLQSENLIFFKGSWVEIDKARLESLLTNWKKISKMAGSQDGISFAQAMRMAAGFDDNDVRQNDSTIRVVNGKWLEEILTKIKNPLAVNAIEGLQAQLRPYQNVGVSWLYYLNQLKLGAVLADDMGLGKTLQVIALLLIKKQNGNDQPSLLIVPASLLDNWKSELKKFAPTLKFWIAHQSQDGVNQPENYDFDCLITTYNSVSRFEWLGKKIWEILILDEAQAIKNPEAKQSKAIKSLPAAHRIALTGTPIENHLSDLWSLFDFLSPGLLGSASEFNKFIKKKSDDKSEIYATLRNLVSPYILRRMKTDKKIINDLPDKTEVKTYCQLSKSQIVLYQQTVNKLAEEIRDRDGIERSGLIFSYLMRFKQICNHPSQFLKDGIFASENSGKFLRLKELCELIAEKQERLLVFTQFKEMTQPLSLFLQEIFGATGLVLHGSTPVKKRAEMVSSFQKEDGPPFFILSLKAGGTGLNLTSASHVIHFDRWWNPAIENQATDRAFRIGQQKNVLVHKFICSGTLEDKIDQMIDLKQNLSKTLLDVDETTILTKLSNQELIQLVSLNLNSI